MLKVATQSNTEPANSQHFICEMRLAFLALLTLRARAAPAADAVTSLPGYGKPPTPQYSGYLDAGAAEPGTMLHYWFAASSLPNAHDTPVVLWLNGGPGSSSVLGMLQEQGPLIIDRDGGLMENPYAWTKVANFFVVESPGGVGYSYCAAMKTGGSCSNTDITTAKAAHAALQDFFTSKFPELRGNPFYITGAGAICRVTDRGPIATPGFFRLRLTQRVWGLTIDAGTPLRNR